MEEKSIKKNTILNSFRMVLTVLFPLITFPYTSRIFLADGIGKLSFAQSVTNIFSLFASLGIYTYGIREGSKYRTDRDSISAFASQIFAINSIATLITYSVFISCIFISDKFWQYRFLLAVYGINIGFSALGFDWLYGVYEEYEYITKRQIICQLITIISLFAFVHEQNDIYIWATISVFSNVGANIFNLLRINKYINLSLKSVNIHLLKIHIAPILVLFATKISSVVYSNVDSILLGFLSSESAVGVYSASVKINSILITFFSAMSPVFVPRLIEYLKDKLYESYYSLIRKALSLIIMLGLPAIVGLELLSQEIIFTLSGKAFISACTTMRIITPVILINSVTGVIYYDFLVPRNKEKIVLFCTTLSAIVNIVISSMLIPILNENGAALGSLIAELMSLIMTWCISRKIDSRITKCIPNIARYVIGTFAIIPVIIIIKALEFSTFITLFVSVIGSAIVYIAILFILKDEFMMDVLRWLSKIRRKI